jgi:hypothetical protein
MQTVAQIPAPRKPAIAFYGWLRETHGIFLQEGGAVSFLDDTTQVWQDVDLPTLTTWAVLNGRVDLAEAQRLADGNVYDWIERRNTEHRRAA